MVVHRYGDPAVGFAAQYSRAGSVGKWLRLWAALFGRLFPSNAIITGIAWLRFGFDE
ncbi:hypothetical protein ABC977_11685 [Thioalkalicoccus limnaeus]|uniref:Uncharacterized protein n=1 Tax=Thioalkalicoccus limnaeus TaxID=120681 RepID=A0ABV4BEZ6_9GAMM